jgi:hypothetical protein
MNWKEMRKRLSGTALAAALMFAFAIAASSTAQAQNRDYDYRNDRNGRYDQRQWDRERTKQYGFIYGYHIAYSEARNVSTRNFKDAPGYRNPVGHLSIMGYLDTYRDNYRRGFEIGFKESQSGRERRYRRADVERVLGGNIKEMYSRYGNYDPRYDRDDDYYDRDGRGGYDRDGRGGYDRGGNGRYDRNEVSRIAQENGYRSGLRSGEEDRTRRRSYRLNDSSDYRNATDGYRSEYGDRNLYQQAFRDGFRRGYDEGYRRSNNNGRRNPWPF